MSGLDLEGFLGHDPDAGKSGGGGGGNWLKKWKDAGKLTFWLHGHSKIHWVWGHKFIEVGEAKEEGSDKKKPVLRFPNFVGPDNKEVYANQFFRENGRLKVLPNRDPFILLREWLRYLGEHEVLPLDTVVFEWTDYKQRNSLIQWELGRISGLVKSNQSNWNHSIDGKLSCLLTVVDNDNLAAGPKLTSESKMVGQELRKVIQREMESNGVEKGDPFKHPYAFRIKYDDKAKSFSDTYSLFRFNDAAYTREVWDQVWREDAPDAVPFTQVKDDDLTKIRAAMQNAMQIELPLDLIFSTDLEARLSVLKGAGAPGARTRSSGSGSSTARPPAEPGADRPAGNSNRAPPPPPGGGSEATGGRNAPPPPAGASGEASAPPRRKKVVEAAPPPPPKPEVPMTKCDECQTPMKYTDAKCSKCGAEYEVDAAPDAAPAQQASPATSSGKGAPPPPPPSSGGTGREAHDVEGKCSMCRSEKGFHRKPMPGGKWQDTCKNCGADQSDDIPF